MDQLWTFIAAQPEWLQALIGITAMVLAATAVNFIIKKVILRAAAPWLDRRSQTVDKAAARAANVVPLLIISEGIRHIRYVPEAVVTVVVNVVSACIVLSIALAVSKMLSYLNELYERRPEAANRPIKGYVQVLKIALYMGAAILVVAVLMEQSPLLLFSGLGAMAAVLLLVFKDTILSLVASVQLASNDMLRVGDWIEMPELNANGDVIDIALHTVKVRNFDKTITTIPTYRLISDSFKNWRGMKDTGARRMKRPLLLDQNSVRFLEPEEVRELRRFRLLGDYLARKDEELRAWNEAQGANGRERVNRRRITNIGTFRAYVMAYLQAHPGISRELTWLVRQLDPTPEGLPLEIYCFANTTDWATYEGIQSDIFDHLLAILPEFGLRPFQQPSGRDLQDGLSARNSEPAREVELAREAQALPRANRA